MSFFKKVVTPVAKTVGNIITGGPTIGAVKSAISGGNVLQGALKGAIGQEGVFGSPSNPSFNPFSRSNYLSSASQNESGFGLDFDGSKPPPLLDPRSAEYAFEEYQKKYGGRLPLSAVAAQNMATKEGARIAESGIQRAASAGADAMSTLARKGGLSQGAMERLARGSAYDALLAAKEGASAGSRMAQQAGVEGLRQTEQDIRSLSDAYMKLLMQNQEMQNQIYAANKGAQILANQPKQKGLFGGEGFLGLGFNLGLS